MQRRAANFVKNLYSTTPGTVTPILHDLKWLTLEKRRKVTLHTIMFKVVSGLSAIQFPPYILFKRRQGTRQFHPKKLIQVGANTNKYQSVLLQIQSQTGTPYQMVSYLKSSQSEAFKKAHMCHL